MTLLLALLRTKHLSRFKPWESLSLLCFFSSSLLRFLSWLYVNLTEDTARGSLNEEFYLQLLDDMASLIAWAVLMNFVVSMQELKVVLESESSQAMRKGVGKARWARRALMGNLIVMNCVIIGSESYLTLWPEEKEVQILIRNIAFLAYCIEFSGDILCLSLFGYLLSYFLKRIQQARLSINSSFTAFNRFIIFSTWLLLNVQFLFSLSYLVVSYYEYYLQVPATSALVLAAKIAVFRIAWPIKDLVT